MGPNWYERQPKLAQKILDQVFHALAGSSISALAGGIATIWFDGGFAGLIGATASALAAGLRELTQNWGDTNNDDAGNWLDWAVWTIAAVGPGLAYWRWT